MNNPCFSRVICECAEDNPFANLSAEAPDVDRFFALVHFAGDPPLGDSFVQLGCLTVCESTISQADADLCALRQAQQCVWDNPGFGGDWRTPPTIQRPNGSSVQIFSNHVQSCTTACPDGLPFTFTVAAGQILALSQEEADFLAYSYACQKAQEDIICLSIALSKCCQNEFFQTSIVATGGALGASNSWSLISGSLPPGLTFHGGTISGLTLHIDGVPTTTGSYSFSVQVAGPTGQTQTKNFSITVAGITNASPLPDAHIAEAYSQTLVSTGISGSVTWSIITGALPSGLSLNATTGLISGTPTAVDSVALTVQATNSSDQTCIKLFTLDVACLEPLAYWTMDEAGSVIRTDAIEGVTQDPNFAGVGVSSAAGLIGNAAKFTVTNLNDLAGLFTVGANKIGPAGPSASLFFWINFVNYNVVDASAEQFVVDFQQYDSIGNLLFELTFVFNDFAVANTSFTATGAIPPAAAAFAPTANQWYSVYLYHDGVGHSAGYEIYKADLLQISQLAGTLTSVPSANDPVLDVSNTKLNANAPALTILYDEAAVFGQLLTASQRAYLRNAGAGRQWPFCLPP